MTYRIAKSQTFPGFEVAVAAHAKEMRDWRSHMARVADDEKNGVAGAERHVAHPRPGARAMVEACVNENDEADYEIVDDGPTPAQRLAAKKNELLGAVSRAEAEAITAVVPAGKQRLFSMREEDIRAADVKIAQDVGKPGLLTAAASAVGLAKPVDIPAEIEKRRSAEDTRFLLEQAERRNRIGAIERAAAQMHADIEDLTIDNVDAWKMTPFPT